MPDVKKNVSPKFLNPPPPVTKINSSLTLGKKEIKESNNSKASQEFDAFNNKNNKLEEKSSKLRK